LIPINQDLLTTPVTRIFIDLIIEFLAATIDTSVYLKEERLYEAFRLFDKVLFPLINRTEAEKLVQMKLRKS
jgi:BarA-like signal transduction histidine kinase